MQLKIYFFATAIKHSHHLVRMATRVPNSGRPPKPKGQKHGKQEIRQQKRKREQEDLQSLEARISDLVRIFLPTPVLALSPSQCIMLTSAMNHTGPKEHRNQALLRSTLVAADHVWPEGIALHHPYRHPSRRHSIGPQEQ